MKKKSLVGWMFKDWYKRFLFCDNGYGENILFSQHATKKQETKNQVRIRITIEELTTT